MVVIESCAVGACTAAIAAAGPLAPAAAAGVGAIYLLSGEKKQSKKHKKTKKATKVINKKKTGGTRHKQDYEKNLGYFGPIMDKHGKLNSDEICHNCTRPAYEASARRFCKVHDKIWDPKTNSCRPKKNKRSNNKRSNNKRSNRRNRSNSKKDKRPSPSISATKFKVGTVKQGNDNHQWIVTQNKNGVKRWVKHNDDPRGKNKQLEKMWKSLSDGKSVIFIYNDGTHKVIKTEKPHDNHIIQKGNEDKNVKAILTAGNSWDSYRELYSKAKNKSVKDVLKNYKKYFPYSFPNFGSKGFLC
tara:strand:+ start:573 stop:1472 length:900 start_codon:yes stop_codon:yes gene_type:complete